MTPTKRDGEEIGIAVVSPLTMPAGVTRQYSFSINGRFRAPYGIPDLLDPSSFAIVFKNTDPYGENPRLQFPQQATKGKTPCWLQPQGCPLSTLRMSLNKGDYIVCLEATTKLGAPVILCYYTDKTSLGTHDRNLATIVSVGGTQSQIDLNPTIEMNLDQVV